MDKDFIFRSGKFAGKTYGWVAKNASWYIDWVITNRPEMLKPIKPKKQVHKTETKPTYTEPPEDDAQPKGMIQPNLNFDNEGPLNL